MGATTGEQEWSKAQHSPMNQAKLETDTYEFDE